MHEFLEKLRRHLFIIIHKNTFTQIMLEQKGHYIKQSTLFINEMSSIKISL